MLRTFSYLCHVKREYSIVAFTGHRHYDGSANDNLRQVVAQLYAEGARQFRVGMAEGFDLAAAEAVIEFMDNHDDIELVAHAPWPEFYKLMSSIDQQRYHNILDHCSITRYTAPQYNPTIFRLRNDRLVEDADTVVAWWDGSQSGTGYTVRRARAQHCRIVNLYPDPQQSLDL